MSEKPNVNVGGPAPARGQMWSFSIKLALILFAVLLVYTSVYNRALSFLAVTQATAGTAAVMIGLSFAMSGLNYFFGWFKKMLAFRKYIGLTGFWVALLYSLYLWPLEPDKYFFGFFSNLFTLDILLGLAAMAIFAMMAIISLDRYKLKLGLQKWRSLLRLGYVGYGLLVVRGIVLEWDSWWAWMTGPDGLAPPRLVVSVVAVLVIGLRLIMALSLQKSQPAMPEADAT